MPATEIDFSRFTLRKDVAPHRQVAAYLKALIALGQVHPGETVPSPSALGYRFKITATEVKRAYTELVGRGFLVTRGGKWQISDEHGATSDAPALEDVCDRLWDLVLEARQIGMTRAELQRMFSTLLDRS